MKPTAIMAEAKKPSAASLLWRGMKDLNKQ